MSNLDDLLTSGGKTFKFETPGDTITGVIASIDVMQARDFDTGKPAVWDDGNPQEQIRITLETSLRDPSLDNDEGARSVYIKGWGNQLRSFKEAVRQAGGKPTPGDTFTATYTGDGEKPARGFAPKLYNYQIVKASPLDRLTGDTAPAAVPTPTTTAPADDLGAKVRQLIGVGLDDTAIASALTLDAAVVAAIRAAA